VVQNCVTKTQPINLNYRNWKTVATSTRVTQFKIGEPDVDIHNQRIWT